MHLTIGKKIGLGFGVLLALVATLAVVVLFRVDTMQSQFAYVIEHDAPVIANARHLLRLVVDMETGQRGFVITGKQEFLEPYDNASNEFSVLVDLEKTLVQDNPSQVHRLEKIEASLRDWQAKAALPEIAMRRKILAAKVGARQLQEILANGVGKGILDEIRIVANDMEQQFRIDGNMNGVFLLKWIQKCMVDQETGERGFLITGKDEFLEPFDTGQAEFKEAIAELRSLVASAHDRAATVSDLNELGRLYSKWIAEAANPEIQLRRQVTAGEKTQNDIELALRKNLGNSILDDIRAVLDQMSQRFIAANNRRLQSLNAAVVKAVADQDTGRLGFLVTGKDEFLQPFVAGREQWNAAILELRNLNAKAYDLPTMKRNIAQLEKLAKKWLDMAASPEIATRRTMNEHPESLQDVAAMLEIGTGKRILDSIREDFQLFIAEEEKLTAQRFAAASLAADTTTRSTIVLALISLIFGGIMAIKITLGITRPVCSLATAVGMVAKGDLGQEIKVKSNDEIGALSRSFNQMIGNLRRLEHDQATLEREREVHAEKLTRSNADLAKEAGRKDAHATLAEVMREANDIEALSNNVISFLTQNTQSHVGAVYLTRHENENENELYLAGSYAFTKRKRLIDRIKIGETLVGQAALEKKSILITSVPEDYIMVSSGLGETVPRNLLVVPLLRGRKLAGVVELGSFESFTDDQIAEIEAMGESIAIAINSLYRGERIQSLLEETQRKTEALGSANSELEMKSKDLEQQRNDIETRNTELEIAGMEIEEQAQELMLASKYKSEFLANMSHEIRTPMTAILGFTELVLDNVSDPQNIEGLKTIQKNGEHLIEIINDILDLSKIESGKFEIENVECSPCEIIEDVASLMRVRSNEKGLGLTVEYDGPVPLHIQSDPTRLRQILLNLTGNAIKFTETGMIRLVVRMSKADSDGPKIQFDVVDTGIGIAEEQVSKLFQPFVQVDTSVTRKFGGTGLGLAISKRLAGMLGGGVTVHSVLGEGSVFSVTISAGPLEGVKMIDSPNQYHASTVEVAKPAAKAVRINGRVLVAEDGPDNRRLLSLVLTKAGADLAFAENGQIAFDLAIQARDEGRPFDVILMDMQMPVLDGYSATGKLRDAGYSGPIIALTAHAMAGDRQKCLDAGCDDFTTKPIDKLKLITKVNSYMTSREPGTTSQENTSDALVSELADNDLQELIDMFIGDLPDRIEAIEKAVEEQDFASLTTLTHQLVGAAGGYGFPAISTTARLLETTAKAGVDSETLTLHTRALADLCSRAHATLPTS